MMLADDARKLEAVEIVAKIGVVAAQFGYPRVELILLHLVMAAGKHDRGHADDSLLGDAQALGHSIYSSGDGEGLAKCRLRLTAPQGSEVKFG